MKLTAEQTLIYLIKLLSSHLEELEDAQASDKGKGRFVYGEKTAYTECLEVVRLWNGAEDCGLDFDVEERFPL